MTLSAGDSAVARGYAAGAGAVGAAGDIDDGFWAAPHTAPAITDTTAHTTSKVRCGVRPKCDKYVRQMCLRDIAVCRCSGWGGVRYRLTSLKYGKGFFDGVFDTQGGLCLEYLFQSLFGVGLLVAKHHKCGKCLVKYPRIGGGLY